MRFEIVPPHHPATTVLAEAGALHRCPNCGTAVMARFCGNCGQSRHDHSRSLLEMVRELIEHHLFLDGKMMATLAALLVRPGLLTRAFIEGRRVRFVSPIRLYLFVSFAFFLALWVSGFALVQFHIPQAVVMALSSEEAKKSSEPAEAATDDASGRAVFEFLRPAHDGEAVPAAIKSHLNFKADIASGKLQTDSDPSAIDFLQRLVDGFSIALAHPRALNPVLDEWLPRLLIVTLPFAALLLALCGRKRGLYFVDHVTFALHLQAFLFVVGLVVILVRIWWPTASLGWPLLVIFPVYTYVAYLRTYPGNWLWAGVKLGFITVMYGISLFFGLLALLVYGVSTLPGA